MRARNLGFDRKLGFVRDAIGLHSDALRRLAKLRNDMEHDFSLPSLADLEAHSDLVSLFVAMLQQSISFSSQFEGEYVSPEGACLSVFFDEDDPSIRLEWGLTEPDNVVSAGIEQPDQFAYLFRVDYLLYHRRMFGREDVMLRMLEPTQHSRP